MQMAIVQTGQGHLAELSTLEPSDRPGKGYGRKKRELGLKWVETFQAYADLKPDEAVLDVGCGPGRMALALAAYLGPEGRYEGFDVNPADIDWCKSEIEPRWPNSRFQLIDLHNGLYNPDGAAQADRVRFPYDDGTFDFVFMTSVLTHLLPDELSNYLHETARVLKPSGRCLITYFVLNETARAGIHRRHARFTFSHPVAPSAWTESPDQPERAIAYEEGFLREEYRRANLAVVEPIRPGAWSGVLYEPPPRHSQDTVVARPRA